MSGLVFSQENIDEDFLMSLPSEIRNDFIKEMGENAQVEDQVFNPPNTAIRTLGANLQQIMIDIRNIAEELASKNGTDTKEITRFGTNFFNFSIVALADTNPICSVHIVELINDLLAFCIIFFFPIIAEIGKPLAIAFPKIAISGLTPNFK